MSQDNTLLLELMADQAVGSLAAEDKTRLDSLLAESPDHDDDSMALAAAAADLAFMAALGEEETPLPASVRAKLKTRAAEFAEGPNLVDLSDWKTRQEAEPGAAERSAAPTATSQLAWIGWLAAAVFLAVGLTGWWPKLFPPQDLSAAELRAGLLAEAEDAVTLAWTATEDAAAVGSGGNVVWSDERQSGYMLIRGLQPNDVSVEQYQLWIFSKDRPGETPVDGGVFDIPAGASEVVVPIDAKLAVVDPQLFAITVERPGGVVVSKRERIVLLAQPEA